MAGLAARACEAAGALRPAANSLPRPGLVWLAGLGRPVFTPDQPSPLRTMEKILAACGCRLSDVAKVNVFLTEMADFGEMNEAYLDVFGADPPARITTGCTGLALGALVEMDCVAFRPDDAPDLGDIA